MGDQGDRCMACYELKREILRCGRCKGFYCSKKCQAMDWKVHKIFCGRLPNDTTSSEIRCIHRSYTVQALLLPHDTAEPRLVPVEIPPSGLFDVENYVPGGPNQVKLFSTEDAPQALFNNEEYEMPCGFFFLHNHYTTIDPSEPENLCTKAIMKAKAKSFGSETVTRIMGENYWKELLEDVKKWKGNVLVLKTDRWQKLNRELNRNKGPDFYNVDMKDIPDAVGAFWIYSGKIASR